MWDGLRHALARQCLHARLRTRLRLTSECAFALRLPHQVEHDRRQLRVELLVLSHSAVALTPP